MTSLLKIISIKLARITKILLKDGVRKKTLKIRRQMSIAKTAK